MNRRLLSVAVHLTIMVALFPPVSSRGAGYRDRVREYLEAHPPSAEPDVAMKYHCSPKTLKKDIAFLREVGVNVVWSGKHDVRPALAEAGFKCMQSGSPSDGFSPKLLREDTWVKRLFDRNKVMLFVYRSAEYEAGAGPLSFDITENAPDRGDGEEGEEGEEGDDEKNDSKKKPKSTRYFPDYVDPKEHWRVRDKTAGRNLDPGEWSVDPGTAVVIIPTPVQGHVYQVAYLVGGLKEVRLDIFYPEVREAILENYLNPIFDRGPVHIYRPTSLGYRWDRIQREDREFHTRWTSQRGLQPDKTAQFEKDTGVKFDLDWWIDDGRVGSINYPPPRQHVAWAKWRAEIVEEFSRGIVETVHKRGAVTRFFLGDNHLGAELFMGFLDKTGMDEMTKPSRNSVDVKLVMEAPARKTKKYIRFGDWLYTFPKDPMDQTRPARQRLDLWMELRKVMLGQAPDGLTWGSKGLNLKRVARGPMADTIRDINDEFRLIHSLLNGKKSHRHDYTLYVVNAWGALRAWAMGYYHIFMFNPCYTLPEELTTLPIDIRFVSIDKIAENGVPGDADAILNYGEPGSAWSGGFHWEDGRAARAIDAFVRGGGGFIGVDAPGFHRDKEGRPVWPFAEALGLDFDGFVDEGAERGLFSINDLTCRRAHQKHISATVGEMKRNGSDHWIGRGPAESIGPVKYHVRVKPVAGDVQVVYGGDGPLVAAREHGKGRVVYVSGYATDHRFYEKVKTAKSIQRKGAPGWRTQNPSPHFHLLRRAIFWAGRGEDKHLALTCETDNAFVYLYPTERLLVVSNASPGSVEAVARCDVALLGTKSGGAMTVRDVLDSRFALEVTPEQFANGLKIPLEPYAARFLKIEP